jgi:hypothetical protein
VAKWGDLSIEAGICGAPGKANTYPLIPIPSGADLDITFAEYYDYDISLKS